MFKISGRPDYLKSYDSGEFIDMMNEVTSVKKHFWLLWNSVIVNSGGFSL